MGPRTWQILLVEDEPADAEFTEYSFGQGAHHHQITVHQTSASALSFLESTERSKCFPDLILLDVNLPDVTGAELVRSIEQFWFDKAILPPSEEHGLAN